MRSSRKSSDYLKNKPVNGLTQPDGGFSLYSVDRESAANRSKPMKIIIIEIKALAHVDLAIYTVDGVKCASFVKRGELPTVETASAEEQLIAAGGKLWTGGTKRRIYFNSRWDLLGLECRYYGTGNIAEATLNGEKISNGQARKFMSANCATTYFDLVSNEWEDAKIGAIIEATLSI